MLVQVNPVRNTVTSIGFEAGIRPRALRTLLVHEFQKPVTVKDGTKAWYLPIPVLRREPLESRA